jgi:hypothetical protein
LISGSITWQAGGFGMPAAPLAYSESAAVGTCALGGLQAEMLPDNTVNAVGPNIQCDLGGGSLYASVLGLDDPRPFVLGNTSLSAAQAGLVIEFCEPQRGAGCRLCRPNVQGVSVKLVVDEATGGAAPYPTMVTAHYRRNYQIQVDTGAMTDTACGTIAVSVTVQLQQTNADIAYDPNGPCICD